MTRLSFARTVLTLCGALATVFSAMPASGQTTAPEQCTQGTVIFAQDATLSRPQFSLQRGELFTASGGFEEHGVDEPCDPGLSFGPYEVDAGGEIVLRVQGNPPAPNVWSLYNNGVGVSVYFEPRIGTGFGSAVPVASATIPAGESEAVGGGSWSGAGRITAYAGSAGGAGPLSYSCFGQSFSAVAEVVAVEQTQPLVPGMIILPGDRIQTGPGGRVLVQGSNEELGPDTTLAYSPPSIGPATGGPPMPVGYVPHPGIAEDYGIFGTFRNGDYSRNFEMWSSLQNMVQAMREKGYAAPSPETLAQIDPEILMEAFNRIKTMQNGCQAAHDLTLYLQSRSDSVQQVWRQAAAESALVWLLPNNYKLADLSIRTAFRLVGSKLKAAVPLLGQFELAENLMGTADVLYQRLIEGTPVGQRGRWGLEIYERALERNWTAETIEAERRQRAERSNEILSQIEGLPAQLDLQVDALNLEVAPRLEAISASLQNERERLWARRTEELAVVASDRAEWQQELVRYRNLTSNPDMLPGVGGVIEEQGQAIPTFRWVKMGTDEENRRIEEGFNVRENAIRSSWRWDLDKAEAAAAVQRAPIQAYVWGKKLALAQEVKSRLSEALAELARLEAESMALKNHVLPVVTNKCVPERPIEPLAACQPKQLDLLGGRLRYWVPEWAKGWVPEGNAVENPRSSFFGVNLFGVSLDDFFFVPKGTDFELIKTETGGELRVYDGAVTVRTPDGRLGLVEAGQMITIPEGVQTTLPEGVGAQADQHGLPLRDLPFDSNIPAPSGQYPLALTDAAPANGWLWQDPGGDATIATGAGASEVIVTVPDGNEFWQHRGDAPRLLHKATGDFDLTLGLNLSLPEGANHFAIAEFVLYAPGTQIGFLAGQAGAQTAPGADYRLMNGGWSRIGNVSSLPLWDQQAGITPPDDATALLRFTRRGNIFASQWSLDGTHWTLGTRQLIDLPDTIWTGMLFKRMAQDGHPEPAVNVLTDPVLVTAPQGELPSEPVLVVQGTGEVTRLVDSWQMAHNAATAGQITVTTANPIDGDFDAVLRVDLGQAPGDGAQGVATGLVVTGARSDIWAYVALSGGSRHGGRYQTHANGADYIWQATGDTTGWLRLMRKDGVIRASYWHIGRWIDLPGHEVRRDEPVFLGVRSWNGWIEAAPYEFTAWAELERLALDEDADGDYSPQGYALLPEADVPQLELPPGVTIKLVAAPYSVQAPFFDAEGNVYLLPAERDTRTLLRLRVDGRSELVAEGDVFAGLNRKRGLWLGDRLLVTVDGWSEGGNRLWGLHSVAADGTSQEIPLSQGLGGLACLRPGPVSGTVLLCDFENDGVWQVSDTGGELVNLTQPRLSCPQDAAASGESGLVYAVNNDATYSCDGQPGLFRLRGGAAPERVLVPDAGKDFGGLVWTTGGLFGGGLLLVDPGAGALLLIDEEHSTARPVLTGLEAPGDLAAMPNGSALALLLGDRQLLLLTAPAGLQQEPTATTAPVPDPAPLADDTLTDPVAVLVEPTAPGQSTGWVPDGDPITIALDSIAAVGSGPTQPTVLRFDQTILLRTIMTYHWNSGRGAQPGTIALRHNDGTIYGPWQTSGRDGQGGVPSAYWDAEPGVILPPGTYTVLDSDPATWATNAETSWRGIFRAELQRLRLVELPAAPTPVSPGD